MIPSKKGLTICSLVAVLVSEPASIQPTPDRPGAPIELPMIYGTSGGASFAFDMCGDAALGQAYRNAILALARQCELPDPLRVELQALFASDAANTRAELEQYHALNGRELDAIQDGRVPCSKVLTNPQTKMLREKLSIWANGSATPASALGVRCENLQPQPVKSTHQP